MTTNHVGTETIMPENHFESRSYKVRFLCERCGHEFSRTYKHVPAKDPPCPRRECVVAIATETAQRENENLRQMLEQQRAPAHIGESNTVKAVDETANIVMEDYQMTDLRDGVRPGESVAPKLPVKHQEAADNYFGQQKAMPVFGESKTPTLRSKQMQALGRRAIAGAFRNMAVAPTAVTPRAAQGQPALTQVGTRSNDLYTGPRR